MKVESNSPSIMVKTSQDLENSKKNDSGEQDVNSGEPSQNTVSQRDSEKEIKKVVPDTVKAVYATGWVMGTPSLRKSMIESLKENGFNAIVIDIKDEAGQLSYDSKVQTAIDIKASRRMISNIESVIQELKDNNIYIIGRIVTFKDPIYAANVTSIAYKTDGGSMWCDYSGNHWPNPYNVDSWNYPIELAKEAAELGFDEIQFDYIRFPSSEGKVRNAVLGFDSNTKTKADIITEFLEKVMKELKPYGVTISADVFGITTKKEGDFENIGQDFARIAEVVDVICPMVYPSHYGSYEYKVPYPDKEPYEIIKGSLIDAQKRLGRYKEELIVESGELLSGEVKRNEYVNTKVIIRPYLQDFTASWLGNGKYLVYGTEEVRLQIQAAYDLGIEDFCLWDPSNKYCYSALKGIEENKTKEPLE